MNGGQRFNGIPESTATTKLKTQNSNRQQALNLPFVGAT
jgi:hypothetical protein